jgi:phosphoserine phosphatase RsbU/P
MVQPSLDRLELLYHILQTFNSSLDLNQVLDHVMDEVIQALHAERGFVMLRDHSGNLLFKAARGMDQRKLGDADFNISRSIVDRVAKDGQPLLTSNAQVDARFDQQVSVHVFGLLSILCVPLQLKGETIGVVYVDNRLQTGMFRREDLEMLTFIASSAAIAIENARLYALAIDQGRIEKELQMAREVQSSLIPTHTPEISGWQFAASWKPAREVSGDYYDFIQIKPDILGLVIADVSDKGMPAALFMALTRSTVRASVTQAFSLANGISQANRLISNDSSGGMFVTLFYAQLALKTGQLNYVNAGHNPPLIYHRTGDEWMSLTRTGVALGIEENQIYAQMMVQLNPGDFILMYTDGLTDAIDPDEKAFGEERLHQALSNHRHESASDILAGIQADVNQFIRSSEPFDDITALVIKRDDN